MLILIEVQNSKIISLKSRKDNWLKRINELKESITTNELNRFTLT